MIDYDETLISKWLNKIVYIPNGGGKTTSSKRFLEELRNNGNQKADLFTRSSLEKLISIGDPKRHEVYFGFDAAKIERRNQILNEIAKEAPLGKYAQANYSVNAASKAREASFYFSYNGIQNLTGVPSKISKPRNISQIDLNENGVAQNLDKVLKAPLYNLAKGFIKEIEEKNISKLDWDANYDLPLRLKDELMDLYIYCVLYNVKTCLLCGHVYRSPKRLKEKLNEHFSKLTFQEGDKASKKAMDIAAQIYVLSQKDNMLHSIFKERARTAKGCYRDIKLFVRLCDLVLYHISKQILQVPLEGNKTIEDCSIELKTLENTIRKHASNKRHVERFNKYLLKELESIVHFGPEMKVEILNDNFGLKFLLKNKKANPVDLLSESEMKRLALVALKAEIHFKKTEILILDDPIDSYDDYNKEVCINYISGISKMKMLKGLYILSNDFETIFKLSLLTRKDVIFYLPDFDKSLGGAGLHKFIEIKCDWKDVFEISKNEINYLTKLIGEKEVNTLNNEMILVSLILSCRNLNIEIIQKLNRLIINKGTKKVPVIDTAWANDVNARIVRNVEHYMPSFLDPNSNSDTTTYGEVCDCFSRLSSAKSYPFNQINDTRIFVQVRENLAISSCPIGASGYGAIINYVCKKMIIISHIKYLMEKKLVCLIEKAYGQDKAKEIVLEKSFGKKLVKAKDIDSAGKNVLQVKLLQFSKIQTRYSTMYNLFDHGLIQQISPYLPASNVDILNFYKEVKKI